VGAATTQFEDYNYAGALESIESFFWDFCDNYVELVKTRAYEGDASALATLRTALSVLHRLFAPFLPFAAEEAWSWSHDGSLHRTTWPTAAELDGWADADDAVYRRTIQVITAIRGAKTDAKVSQRATVERCTVTGPGAFLASVRAAEGDVRNAGSVAELDYVSSDDPGPLGYAVAVTLAATPV
jgi:valyl-tRNA synthetase